MRVEGGAIAILLLQPFTGGLRIVYTRKALLNHGITRISTDLLPIVPKSVLFRAIPW